LKDGLKMSTDNIKDTIRLLVQLQEIERQTAAIQLVLNAQPQKMKDLESQRHEAKAAVTKAETLLAELQKMYREQESESKQALSRVAKSEEKLRSVKTNKEYQSLLKEIDELKATQSKIEDRMLEILEEMDEAETEISEKKKDYASENTRVKQESEQLQQDAEQKKSELENLSNDLQSLLGKLDPVSLKKYQSVKKVTDGIAVAAVKNAVCLGCNVNIPPQMFNELQRFDKLLRCPFCQRIIYPVISDQEG
jgi:predicted  nucleic acid-binding Zn-ribbon protein